MPEPKAIRTTIPLLTERDRDELSRLATRLRAMANLPFSQLIEAAGLSPKRDLRRCDWAGISFDDEDLSGYDFTGADLTGCSFRGARISKAVFTDADVDESQLWQAADFDRYAAAKSFRSAPADMTSGAESGLPSIPAKLSAKELEAIRSQLPLVSRMSDIRFFKAAAAPAVSVGAALLTSLDLDLANALESLARTRAVERYGALQRHVHSGGAIAPASNFSRQFNHYYRVRRSPEWQEQFFSLLRELRDRGSYQDIQFRDVLQELWTKCGRLEASFASKLVATLDPNRAVLDSIVLARLGLRLPYHNQPDRFERTVQVYDELCMSVRDALRSPLWARHSEAFDAAFPARALGLELTETKKLDLLLWADRPAPAA